jgi:hypothetical protein
MQNTNLEDLSRRGRIRRDNPPANFVPSLWALRETRSCVGYEGPLPHEDAASHGYIRIREDRFPTFSSNWIGLKL